MTGLLALSLISLGLVKAQTCTTPTGQVATAPGSGSFFSNFANPAGSSFSTYAVAIPPASGQSAAGDRNSTYFPLYYSISNLNAWMTSNGYCPVEVVLAGAFPDVRYFSITQNDMHYAASQHIADLDIDPANSTITNPFVVGSGGSAPAYDSTQYYVVPVSLGSVPNVTGGCQVQPFEEDNLLDATQRHISMDWNTSIGTTPGVNNLLQAHVVDDPSHTASPNTAGAVIVRDYLAPYESCTGALGSVACTKNNDPASTPPYLIVRDVKSGCPYLASYVNQYLLNTVAGSSTVTCTSTGGPNCAAILSTTDLTPYSSGWLDSTQQTQHTWNNNITPQNCYASGASSNVVPWVRSPQYDSLPGADDSYIGGGITTTDLSGMSGGSACGGGSGNGCVIRLRFKLPPNQAATPCPETPPNIATCNLAGNVDLRYMSLTFLQQQGVPAGVAQDYYSADPDGIEPNVSGSKPVSIISLADAAFTTSSGYVTLLIAAGNTLPSWLGEASMTAATVAGVQPVRVNPSGSVENYSAWTVNGYNVVNLGQFTGHGHVPAFSTGNTLSMVIRNTLPANNYNCSGSSVPYFTAEYTTGGGMMGPYVPLVDYVDPNDTSILPHSAPSSTSGLPSTGGCGQLPAKVPAENGPLYLSSLTLDCGSGSNCTNWPNQTWPGITGASPALVCSNTSPNSPQIDFVATQFPVPVDASLLTYPTSPQNCNTSYLTQTTPCSQIVYQTPQSTGVASGTLPPPVPITLVGSGFGYLPNLPQLMASCTGSCSSNYLEISSDGVGSGVTWDTNSGASCQVNIANWIDSTISLLANLPINITDSYNSGTTLVSPLSDFTPWTLMPPPLLPTANFNCPVVNGDTLTFVVTNPQSGSSVSIPWPVSASGTALH